MKEKVEKMIKSGMKLFAHQGFNATSVQEIAEESGISKGAFYLHFKSKDDFLLEILNYNFKTIQVHLSQYEDQDLSTREKFEKQLAAVFAMLVEQRDFFVMLSKEQVVPRNEAIKEVIHQNLAASHQRYRTGLVSVYGEKLIPYAADLAVILEGMFHSYLRLLLIDPEQFDLEKLTPFIMRRMDSMVDDIFEDEPFLSQPQMENLLVKSQGLLKQPNIQHIVQQLKTEINKLTNHEWLRISLQVLEEEIQKKSPRIPVIQGMLANFKNTDSLESYCKEIAAFYGFQLLD